MKLFLSQGLFQRIANSPVVAHAEHSFEDVFVGPIESSLDVTERLRVLHRFHHLVKRKGHLLHQRKIPTRPAADRSIPVITEHHIHEPMQRILDLPMLTYRLAADLSIGIKARDVVTGLFGVLSGVDLLRALVKTNHSLYCRPIGEEAPFANLHFRYGVYTFLHLAVCLLQRSVIEIRVILGLFEVFGSEIGGALAQQCLLVSLQPSQVMPFAGKDDV